MPEVMRHAPELTDIRPGARGYLPGVCESARRTGLVRHTADAQRSKSPTRQTHPAVLLRAQSEPVSPSNAATAPG
jgi:hypothetical protein